MRKTYKWWWSPIVKNCYGICEIAYNVLQVLMTKVCEEVHAGAAHSSRMLFGH